MDGEAILAIVFFGGILLLALCGALSALFARIFIEPRRKKKELLEKEIQARQLKNQEIIKKSIVEGCAAERVKLEAERKELEKQKLEYQEKKDKLNLEYDNKLEELREKYKSEREELREKYRTERAELCKNYEVKNDELVCRENELDQKITEFSNWYEKKKNKHEEEAWECILQNIEYAFRKYDLSKFFKSVSTGRLDNAFISDIRINSIDALNIKAKIKSNGNEYTTTLTSCTCPDYKFNGVSVCKHMLFLMYSMGFLQLQEDKLERSYLIGREYNERTLKDIQTILKKKCEGYPQLAAVMAEVQTLYYEKSAIRLETKTRPAKEEARRIRELRKDAEKVLREKKLLEYQMAYIHELFPNIDEIFYNDFEETDFELETEETTDRVRLFLTPDEYRKLSATERNQLALDKYVANRKNKWQIGRDYEMYIGRECETRGYDVKYTGIIEKLEDMGRDLIVNKENDTYIIQCKNWSEHKEIHEKHIFQLFGTVSTYKIDNPMTNVRGVFVTATKLSDMAKAVAEMLEIAIWENVPLGEFPRIKCNINSETGEKIYHLPFDQQYDSTVIDKKVGECYAFTVEEAEKKGFRRAFKHRTGREGTI